MSNKKSKIDLASKRKQLKAAFLGDNIPKRGGHLSPKVGKTLLRLFGWEVLGEIPNVKKAVVIGLPHTSNFDGLYAIPMILALDLDLKIMGKDSLFKSSITSKFFKWAGIIPINRSNKGSVLQASIERMKQSESLFLGLAPEGTRGYTDKLKSGFYYIAKEANVPIIPVAMDYKTKELRFMQAIYVTDDFDADMDRILSQYEGVAPKYPKNMSKQLKDYTEDRG